MLKKTDSPIHPRCENGCWNHTLKKFSVLVLSVVILISGVDVASSDEPITTTNLLGIDARYLLDTSINTTVVYIDDQVSDGCWTTPNTSKTAIELELARSNFDIVDEGESDGIPFQVWFTAIGYETSKSSCVASYSLSFSTMTYREITINGHKIQELSMASLWQLSGVLSGAKSTMNEHLKESAVNVTQKLLVALIKNKSRVKKELVDSAREFGSEEAASFWENY